MDQEPTVGRIVHVIRQQQCIAGIIVSVSEDGVEVQEFPPLTSLTRMVAAPDPEIQPYVELASARPTSGWHWPTEEHPA